MKAATATRPRMALAHLSRSSCMIILIPCRRDGGSCLGSSLQVLCGLRLAFLMISSVRAVAPCWEAWRAM